MLEKLLSYAIGKSKLSSDWCIMSSRLKQRIAGEVLISVMSLMSRNKTRPMRSPCYLFVLVSLNSAISGSEYLN
jgi:hypothetical protein